MEAENDQDSDQELEQNFHLLIDVNQQRDQIQQKADLKEKMQDEFAIQQFENFLYQSQLKSKKEEEKKRQELLVKNINTKSSKDNKNYMKVNHIIKAQQQKIKGQIKNSEDQFSQNMSVFKNVHTFMNVKQLIEKFNMDEEELAKFQSQFSFDDEEQKQEERKYQSYEQTQLIQDQKQSINLLLNQKYFQAYRYKQNSDCIDKVLKNCEIQQSKKETEKEFNNFYQESDTKNIQIKKKQQQSLTDIQICDRNDQIQNSQEIHQFQQMTKQKDQIQSSYIEPLYEDQQKIRLEQFKKGSDKILKLLNNLSKKTFKQEQLKFKENETQNKINTQKKIKEKRELIHSLINNYQPVNNINQHKSNSKSINKSINKQINQSIDKSRDYIITHNPLNLRSSLNNSNIIQNKTKILKKNVTTNQNVNSSHHQINMITEINMQTMSNHMSPIQQDSQNKSVCTTPQQPLYQIQLSQIENCDEVQQEKTKKLMKSNRFNTEINDQSIDENFLKQIAEQQEECEKLRKKYYRQIEIEKQKLKPSQSNQSSLQKLKFLLLSKDTQKMKNILSDLDSKNKSLQEKKKELQMKRNFSQGEINFSNLQTNDSSLNIYNKDQNVNVKNNHKNIDLKQNKEFPLQNILQKQQLFEKIENKQQLKMKHSKLFNIFAKKLEDFSKVEGEQTIIQYKQIQQIDEDLQQFYAKVQPQKKLESLKYFNSNKQLCDNFSKKKVTNDFHARSSIVN